MIQGNHPLACEGHKTYLRSFLQSHVPTQACVDARYHDDVWGQNLVDIAVMRQVSQVSGQRLKLIDVLFWSPHGCIMDNVAEVIHHSIFLMFIQVSCGIPGQGLRGQV
jgi:hypothetical protein